MLQSFNTIKTCELTKNKTKNKASFNIIINCEMSKNKATFYIIKNMELSKNKAYFNNIKNCVLNKNNRHLILLKISSCV